jgi:DMSO/TMAO reductase YedYZ heme-binding membrane subunit
VGIWAALTGLFHLVLATKLSMNPSYMGAVVDAQGGTSARQLFAWGSVLGYLVGLNFLLLLALSNDRVMRLIGSRWWKRLQRTSYVSFGLTLAHGLAFQVLEARSWALVAVLALTGVVVVAFQVRGALAVRHRLMAAETGGEA